ncbi:MAG: hypothetical protein P4L46_25595 [Fimbriimonas sp.]|nr:hypothetical protein [Fimbriimonas sp.]
MRRIRQRRHRLPPESYVGQFPISFTACVDERGWAFRSAEYVEPFIQLLTEEFARFDCLIPIYCFMPDHLHVISMGMTHMSNGKLAMDAFKQSSGQYFYNSGNRFRWQDEYHDRIIRRSEEWRKKVFYVFQNPVRARLVHDPRSYPFTGSVGYDLEQIICDAAT